MSWIQRLCDTYDYAVTTSAVSDTKNPLPEVGFICENASIEVMLSADGEFRDAEIVQEDSRKTVIPCTLESGMARQNPVSPHPLFDKAKYLALENQLSLLQEWCEREDTPQSVKTLYSYLKKQTLLSDLEKCFSMKQSKWSDGDYVRFSIIDGTLDQSGLWLRKNVKESWKKFFADRLGEKNNDLCYACGKILPIATKHPAIGTTLLISMVDSNCEGHFNGEPLKAASVSCEATIKAHNAWKWLAARQGKHLFGMTFVAWDTRGAAVPDAIDWDPADDDEDEDEAPVVDTNFALGESTSKAIGGYWSQQLTEFSEMSREEESTVIMMAVDSATGKGRASLVYYQELDGKDYLKNLIHWYNSCNWVLGRYDRDKKYSYKPRTPMPKEICDLLYGEGSNEGQKKMKKQLVKQLLPCITLRRPIPESILYTAFHKSVNPNSFKDKRAWHKAVGVTCALSRKYYLDKGAEHWMALDEHERDRSYLYGRLLAVADKIEEDAQKQGESSRTTNAMRYMQRFQQRPGDTWVTLRLKLEPYFRRLSPKQQGWYRYQLSQIESSFWPGEMVLQQPLDVRFLEGFSCQTTYRHEKTRVNENNNEITNEEE